MRAAQPVICCHVSLVEALQELMQPPIFRAVQHIYLRQLIIRQALICLSQPRSLSPGLRTIGCSNSSPKLYTFSPSSAAMEMSTASDCVRHNPYFFLGAVMVEVDATKSTPASR